jgi:hypothetical protein
MTSRRQVQTGARLRRLLALAVAAGAVACAVGGCAALPEDAPIIEQLDSETGITVARLGRPVELYRETFLKQPAGRFAFIGPFETNSMGARELYLWVALPVDPSGSEPIVEADGAALPLGTAAREASFAGLRKSPYRIPTPWSAMYYYKMDAAMLARLAEARTLTIRVVENTKDGTANTVFTAPMNDSHLKDFAAR